MTRAAILPVVSMLIGALSGCGFLAESRACDAYYEHIHNWPNAVHLVVWPAHVVVFAGCAVADQTVRTFEIVPPACVDADDYILLPINDDNVMFQRTVAVPKLIATPIVFVGSYALRWLFPVEERDRLFNSD